MSRKLTTEIYTKEAKMIHGDRYDYSKTEYVNGKTKIIVICREHGEFEQRPDIHMNYHGCHKCSVIKRSLKVNDFINRSNIIHNFKYDYSKVIIKNTYNEVCIICPEHGEFWQRPDIHLRGHKCQNCNSSKGEEAIKQFLMLNKINYENEKIFVLFKNLDTNYPFKFDFYLPDFNLCIEFDGVQHFKPVFPFNDKERAIKTLDLVKKYDQIKNQYCLDNGIKLLRIPYTHYNNIDKILSKELGI